MSELVSKVIFIVQTERGGSASASPRLPLANGQGGPTDLLLVLAMVALAVGRPGSPTPSLVAEAPSLFSLSANRSISSLRTRQLTTSHTTLPSSPSFTSLP